MLTDLQDEYEALVQFLYMVPVGLVQLHPDGEIMMLNSLCAQLLMPLSRDGGLANLFVALEGVAPNLRHRVNTFTEPSGTICKGMQLHVDTTRSGRKDAQVLSLSLLKLDAERVMAVLDDVTLTVRRDRELKQGQACIQTIVNGTNDYVLILLDEAGRCQAWNPSIERITGFTQAATCGQHYAIFYPPGEMCAERALDRLHEADRSGWSLDEGWRMRADGTRYWGSCLMAPVYETSEPPCEKRAYSLIICDLSGRTAEKQTLGLRKHTLYEHVSVDGPGC